RDAETTARVRRTRFMMSSPEGWRSAKPAASYVGRLACFLAADSLVAIQIPANTARRPTTRLIPIGSPNVIAPTAEATTGLLVMWMAVGVGVGRSRGETRSEERR